MMIGFQAMDKFDFFLYNGKGNKTVFSSLHYKKILEKFINLNSNSILDY
jgi:hypothetical protein